MSKHTPGPWHLEKAIGTGNIDCGWHVEPECIDFKYCGMVASLSDAEHIGGITKDERDANAHLIAAAPDLLAEAEKACDTFEELAVTLRLLGKPLLAEACRIAEQSGRAVIAKATGESA